MYAIDFFNKYNGKKIDWDGAYGAQCVDLFRFYTKEVLQINQNPKGVVGAKDFWTNYPTDPVLYNNFDRITNTPTFVPQIGDVAIWSATSGNSYGHVAVCTGKGDVNTFESFDQNYPLNSACHYVTHNYSGFLGVLRPKKQELVKAQPTPQPTGNRVAQNGVFKCTVDTLNVRRSPSLSGQVVAQYNKGQTVKYDSYIDAEGIRWISYIGASGNRNYIARRELDNSVIYGECY